MNVCLCMFTDASILSIVDKYLEHIMSDALCLYHG